MLVLVFEEEEEEEKSAKGEKRPANLADEAARSTARPAPTAGVGICAAVADRVDWATIREARRAVRAR